MNLLDSGFHKDINIEQSWGLKCSIETAVDAGLMDEIVDHEDLMESTSKQKT